MTRNTSRYARKGIRRRELNITDMEGDVGRSKCMKKGGERQIVELPLAGEQFYRLIFDEFACETTIFINDLHDIDTCRQ